MNTPLQILQRHFGYSSFRLQQQEIIHALMRKRDALVLMPTGGGKSICYQVPALIFDGLTLVISPLIALMKDQVDALQANGIKAAYLNSTQSYAEQEEILSLVRSGEVKLLYLAPERLLRPGSTFFNTLISFNISLIAIDEAHCISHWGHDFRPEYLMLAQLKQALPDTPVIALTATADGLTRKDIVEKLGMSDPAIFISSFNRPNIRYTVEPKRNSFEKLLAFLDKRKRESGIIYCLSRKSTERLAADLTEHGFQALPYHAGLERDVRARHQELFLRDEVSIIVATIAFGMGIDKSNVRFVVHMDLPKNIESYYQETGRAGRDGLDSEALLFYSYGDVAKLKSFVEIDGNPEQTQVYTRKLQQMGKYGELTGCRRKYLLNYFDESADNYCGNCDVCLTRFEQVAVTAEARQVLEAVLDLNERFGAGFVIDFLRGANTSRMTEEHKASQQYGVGAHKSRQEWNSLIRALIEQGYLEKTGGMYPVLQLTDKGKDALDGGEEITITKAKERVEVEQEGVQYEEVLFEDMKTLRRRLAMEANVPAYIILSDATLMELATFLPQSREEFSRINGFGQVKLEKYADAFGRVIGEYCAARQLSSRMHLKPASRPSPSRLPVRTDTKQRTFELFKEGHSVQEIARMRGFVPSTIEGHLAYFVSQGEVPLEALVEPERIDHIREVMRQAGGQGIAPVKMMLGDQYSYSEIRLVMADTYRSSVEEPENSWQ